MNPKPTARKRTLMTAWGLALGLCLTACSAGEGKRYNGSQPDTAAPSLEESSITLKAEHGTGVEENEAMKVNVQVGDSLFTAALEDNSAAAAFVELMEKGPVVIRMSDYSGFEKVGALGTGLPADNSQTTTQSGDIVLYNGNQIVIFYGSNSWSYTRLGKIDDLTGWEEALGSGDVTVTFSMQ